MTDSTPIEDRCHVLVLTAFLQRIPAIKSSIAWGYFDDADRWWVKFAININHPFAWQTVQELGFVLNYVSLSSRLPTVFMPVSPPPYLNGGPEDFLSWVIESTIDNVNARDIAQCLEGRLPRPVEDESQWRDV